MPKKSIDFQKSVIYTIKTGNSLYVGSTTNFTQRKSGHTNCITNENKKNYNLKLYKAIRANDNEWSMLPHSKYPCNDKIEQTIEEQRIRILLNADLNSKCCGTGINRSELGVTEYLRQYCIANKIKIAEKRKHYWTENKDKQNQTVKCECGCNVSKQNLPRHKKTIKHQKWIQSQLKISNVAF